MKLASTPPEVRDYFAFDAESGVLTRIRSDQSDKFQPRPLGGKVGAGQYLTVMFKGRVLQGHRVAWFLHYGADADGFIDHINGNRTDNRIINLRAVTHQQNCFNSRPKRAGRLKGAQFRAGRGHYQSSIRVGSKRVFLGVFQTETEAHEAYVTAAKKYHGEFARTE
jgi:hypothetical protein